MCKVPWRCCSQTQKLQTYRRRWTNSGRPERGTGLSADREEATMSRTNYHQYVQQKIDGGATAEDVAASLRTEFPDMTLAEAAQVINQMTTVTRKSSFQPQPMLRAKAAKVANAGSPLRANLAEDKIVTDAAYQAWLLRLAFPDEDAPAIAEAIQGSYPNLTTRQMAQVLKHNTNQPVFPNIDPLAMAATLVDPQLGSATVTDVVVALRSPGVFPGLEAIPLARALKAPSVFPNITRDEMIAALKAAGYSETEIASVIAQVFPPPPPPTISTLTFADGKATATWNQVDGNDGYQLHLVDSEGNEIGVASVAKDVQTGAVDMPADAPAGKYYAQALTKIQNGPVPIPWGPLSAAFLLKLAAPTITSLIFADGKVTANWNQVDANDGYRVHLVDGQGKEISPAIDVGKDTLSAPISIPTNLAAGTYFAQAMSKAAGNAGIPSNWGATTPFEKLPAPILSPLSFADRTVTASWTRTAGNDGYQLNLRLAPNGGEVIQLKQDVARDVEN